MSNWIALSSAWSLHAFKLEHDGAKGTETRRHALDAVNHALQLAPSDPAVLMQAGLTHWRLGVNHSQQAIAYLQRAVSLDPRSPDAHHSLGRALLMRHDQLILQGGDPTSVLQEAIRENRMAIRLAPNFIGAHNNLAISLDHLAEYTELHGGDPERYLRAKSLFSVMKCAQL